MNNVTAPAWDSLRYPRFTEDKVSSPEVKVDGEWVRLECQLEGPTPGMWTLLLTHAEAQSVYAQLGEVLSQMEGL